MALSHEDKKDVKNALGKAMANKISSVTRDSGKMARAASFEKEQTKALSRHVANRKKNVKAGGFKDEDDYFKNVNPFTGNRRK